MLTSSKQTFTSGRKITLSLLVSFVPRIITANQALFGCNFDVADSPFCQFSHKGPVVTRVGNSYHPDGVDKDFSYQWPYYGQFLVFYDDGELMSPLLTFNSPVCLTFYIHGLDSPRVYLESELTFGGRNRKMLHWKSTPTRGKLAKPDWNRVEISIPKIIRERIIFAHEWIKGVPVFVDHVYVFSGSCLENRSGDHRGCTFDQVPCADGFGGCVQGSKRCDGRSDCADQSDELNCNLRPTEFCSADSFIRCGDGSCVLKAHKAFRSQPVCGRVCEDFADQLMISCRFKCLNGHFIPLHDRCNGMNDCSDWSDESSCPCVHESWFRCTTGEGCIHSMLRCDGKPHCAGGEDEIGCGEGARVGAVAGGIGPAAAFSNRFAPAINVGFAPAISGGFAPTKSSGVAPTKSSGVGPAKSNTFPAPVKSGGFSSTSLNGFAGPKISSGFSTTSFGRFGSIPANNGRFASSASNAFVPAISGGSVPTISSDIALGFFKSARFFKCPSDGKIIRKTQLCDSVVDCQDRSDENGRNCLFS